jgi:hypothetical protein
MDNLGDILGTIFGEGVFGEIDERPERREAPVIVYERYLCGGPKYLGINDR